MWQQQQTYLRGLPSQHPQQQTLHPGIIDTEDHMHHHHHLHQQHHHHRATIIDLPVPSNPRASRNMAEKQRRDNLNTNISTMAALVPIVAGSSRRMDKISILRLAAAFLRTQYTLGSGSTNFLPRQFNEFDLEQHFVDHLVGSGGFFLVVTATGKIVYVSRQVEQHLGHAQNELLGQSLYNFIYPEDHEELTRNLTPEGMPSSSSNIAQISELVTDNSSSSSDDSTSHRADRTKFFHEQRRSFKIRMSQRTVSRREHTQYECLHISGILRLAEACKNTDSSVNRGRHRDLTSTSNDIVFAGIASLPKKRPITELSIIDANKDEYVTRHLVDGRIIYCDHRVSVVAGYLSEEVSGLNAFAFMHKDDFRWTIIGLRQMYDRAETCGSSCYRLLSKTGEFIYLRTHGYLEYDKDTQTVESFVCINTLISEEEGIELIKEMKKRFSATVSGTTKAMLKNSDNSSFELGSDSQRSNSKCSLDDPTQLEDAITHLISDLPSPAMSEDCLSPSPMPNSQYAKAAIFSQRLPPAATQANKIGINKIDHYLVLHNKGNRTPKQEPKKDEYADKKLVNSNTTETSRTSDLEKSKSSDKSLSIHKRTSAHNVRIEGISRQSDTLAISKPNTEPCISGNHVAYLDVPQNVNVLNAKSKIEQPHANMLSPNTLREGPACDIKLEHGLEINHLEKQEPMLQYFDDSASDISIMSTEAGSHNLLKRKYSREDVRAGRSKKRLDDDSTRTTRTLYTTIPTNVNDGQQSVSYVNCRTFMSEKEYPPLSVEFNKFNSQSLITAESPNSSLQEVGVDYQHLVDPAAPHGITNSDEERFVDLQDFKDDTLLSPTLEANPELVMKIFDDLRPVMGFEKGFTETKIQLTPNDQAVNDEIACTHLQLANSIALRESQFNVLARDLENPALRAQRENLSQLQAEHKIQKQMLKNLQQDHHNIQVNVKHNIGA